MKLGHYILDSEDEVREVDLMTWAVWMEIGDRVILQTSISRRGRIVERRLRMRGPFLRRKPVRPAGAGHVSTIFLGLDYGFSLDEDAPPVLWETMVFGGPLSGEGARYTSKLDALTGHAAHVARVQAAAHVPRRLRKALLKAHAFETLGPREHRAVARFHRRAR